MARATKHMQHMHAACLYYFSSFNQSDHCFLGHCCRCECPCLSSQLFAFTTDNLTNFRTPQVDIFSNVTANTPCLSQIAEITEVVVIEEKVHVTYPFAAQMAISCTLHCKDNCWQSTAFLTPGTFS